MVKIGKWYPYRDTPEPVEDDKVVKKAAIHEENVKECKKLLYNCLGTSGDNKSSALAAGNQRKAESWHDALIVVE